jgi:hypothetical protein
MKLYYVFFTEDSISVTEAHTTFDGALDEFRNQLMDVTDIEPEWLKQADANDLLTDLYEMREIELVQD